MKQYVYRSADYVQQDPTVPDAVMDAADLTRMCQLAGIAGPGIAESRDKHAHAGTSNPSGNMSPVGSTASDSVTEKKRIEHENHIKAGTPEWFKLWFSKPGLTNEKPVGEPTGNTLFSRPSANLGSVPS